MTAAGKARASMTPPRPCPAGDCPASLKAGQSGGARKAMICARQARIRRFTFCHATSAARGQGGGAPDGRWQCAPEVRCHLRHGRTGHHPGQRRRRAHHAYLFPAVWSCDPVPGALRLPDLLPTADLSTMSCTSADQRHAAEACLHSLGHHHGGPLGVSRRPGPGRSGRCRVRRSRRWPSRIPRRAAGRCPYHIPARSGRAGRAG